MTIARITGQAAAQAYGGDEVYRVDGGGVAGLLFLGDDGWELHSASPLHAAVSFDDSIWTVRSGGITTTLAPASPLAAPDRWHATSVVDDHGNQVVTTRAADGVVTSIAWGGRVGPAPGTWSEPALYTLDVATEAAPHTSFQAHPGGVTAIDRRITGFTLDASVACADVAVVACAEEAMPAWDLCYAPLGDSTEEVLAAVYVRAGDEPRACDSGETERSQLLAAFETSTWAPDDVESEVLTGAGVLGVQHTDLHARTWQWIDLADANGDGWMDRFDWADGGKGVQALLRSEGPGWEPYDDRSTLEQPFALPYTTYLGASTAAITGFVHHGDGALFGYTPIRTRYTTQKWVDLDRDGFRDLIVAREVPFSLYRATDLPPHWTAFQQNLDLDDGGVARTWTWDIHYGGPWGLEPAVPADTPVKFPGVAHSPSHSPEWIPADLEIDDAYDTVHDLDGLLLDLFDMTGDGYADIVYADVGGLVVYPFEPAVHAWAEVPVAFETPDGFDLSSMDRTTHHTVLDAVIRDDGLHTYQVPRVTETEVTRRLLDLNGDGFPDLVDAEGWRDEDGLRTWDVLFGSPAGFAEPEPWPAPAGFLTRTYEGRPFVTRCTGPALMDELPGGPTPDGPGFWDPLGLGDDLGGDGDGGDLGAGFGVIADPFADSGCFGPVDTGPGGSDDDDAPACHAEDPDPEIGPYDPGEALWGGVSDVIWDGVDHRIAGCFHVDLGEPQRILMDLLDLDGDGRVDLVDADAGQWARNLGDGFAPMVDIPWDAFPSELGRSRVYTRAVYAPTHVEDRAIIDPVTRETSDSRVNLQVRDVNGDGLPDIVSRNDLILAPYRPPGLLQRITWGTGASTDIAYASTADNAEFGVLDAHAFAAHRAVVATIGVYDPVTDQRAERRLTHSRPIRNGGNDEGFASVFERELVSDAKTRWGWGDDLLRTWERTTTYAPHRDFPLPATTTLAADTQLLWAPGDLSLAGGAPAGVTTIDDVSEVTETYEPWERGLRLVRRDVTSWADDGSPSSTATVATWDGADLVGVASGPGPGDPCPADDCVRTEWSDFVGHDDSSLRLPTVKRTFGWDAALGEEVLQEWIHFVYDDGSEEPASAARLPDALVSGALLRQEACGAPAGVADCADAWETWSFRRGPHGEIEETWGPAGAFGSTLWTLGGSVAWETTNGALHTSTSTVDPFGRTVSSTDPNGVRTTTVRDDLGRPVEEWLAGTLVDASELGRRVRTWTHRHLATPEWTEEVRMHQEAPSGPERLRSAYTVRDGLGRTVQSWSPELGPSGFTVTETLHDLSGNPVVVRAPRNEDAFDDAGPSLAEPGPLDTRSYPDALGLVRKAWSPHGGAVTTTRPRDRRLRTIDGGGRFHEVEADARGRTVAVFEGDPTDPTTTARYTWDALGRIRSFADVNANTTGYAYDQVGRLLTVDRRPPGEDAEWEPWYSYAHDGPYPTSAYDRDGTLIASWTHDALGRTLTKAVLRDGGFETSEVVWDDTWIGARAAVIDPVATLTYTYDVADNWGLGHVAGLRREWGDGHDVEWSYTTDSEGAVVRTELPEGITVDTLWTDSHWRLEDAVHIDGVDPITVAYLPGEFGQIAGGWTTLAGHWNCPLEVVSDLASPQRIDRIDVQRPDCDTNQLAFGWDDGGRLGTRSYTGFGDPAGAVLYGYDGLGRIDAVSLDLEPVETIDRDALGVPTSLMRAATGVPADPSSPPLPTTWTYGPAGPFGQVPWRSGEDDDDAWIQEAFTWDAMGRLATVSHREPDERRFESYTYDGLGRLAVDAGFERVLEGGEETELRWTHEHHYGFDDELLYELRSGSHAPKVVHRTDGYLSDSSTGVTVDVLPMLRVVDGEPRFVVKDPSGHAAWVLDIDGATVSHQALGATGVVLHQEGEGWHIDGLHGSQPDPVAGLVHHGARHARLDDGLWMQPEPLLYLGPTNGPLHNPLGLGPAYAAGKTNGFTDRSGYNTLQMMLLLSAEADRIVQETIQSGLQANPDSAGWRLAAGIYNVSEEEPIVFGLATLGMGPAARRIARPVLKRLLPRSVPSAPQPAVAAAAAPDGAGRCFVADTEVITPDGTAAIQDLRVGDTIIAAAVAAVPGCAVHADKSAQTCWRAPRREDLVQTLGTAHTERLADVAVGTHVVYDGAVWQVTASGAQPTGDVVGHISGTYSRITSHAVEATLYYTDGTTDRLTGTANHPFWVDAVRDYVPLGELEVGTVLHVQGGGEAILVSKTWRQGDFEVFDFEVEGLHNFYARGSGSDAAGVLVHNSTGGGEGFLVHPNGTAVHRSQKEMVQSIEGAGATEIGPTAKGDGAIYQMDTPGGRMDVRVMDGTPGGGPHSGTRTVTTRSGTQDAAGRGGEFVQANGDRFPNGTSKADRKAGGHTHEQVNDR